MPRSVPSTAKSGRVFCDCVIEIINQLAKGFLRASKRAIRRLGIPDRNVHDMDLPKVSDLDLALAAINQIIETGEAVSITAWPATMFV